MGDPAGRSVLAVGVWLLVGLELWPPGEWWPMGPMGPPMFIALASELVEVLVPVSRWTGASVRCDGAVWSVRCAPSVVCESWVRE